MSTLDITEVVVTPIAFPDPPLLNAAGVHQPWALRTVIEVHTGDGISGLGESYGDSGHLELLRATAKRLTGLDAFDVAGLRRLAGEVVGGVSDADAHGLTGASSVDKTVARVVSAFETALLDIQGRALGRPVYDLLGGLVRESVPFSAYLFYKWAAHPGAEPDAWGEAVDPEGIVAQARRMIDEYGFRSIKLKGGVFPPAEEIAAIRALREAFPEHPLRLDPNAAWKVATSIWVAAETEGLLEYLEDPAPGIDGMAAVAAAAPMPLATNMCVVGFADIAEAFAKRAVGVVLSDHHFWGGLRASAELAAICRVHGVGLSMHSNSHLGISLAAMTQLAAATPNLTYAVDTHIPWQSGNDVVAEPLSFQDGSIRVPRAPGLGVELDHDALGRMHENYRSCGIRDRDDETYMRGFDASFTNRKAYW
ncbi:glucarate dehydratase family protein [Stackebrandtia nassauensis]|uniref:glucarate dehydratase n=1 Tax=Stackebrandtia nassauensis (strain DSM 44728 / CIP 108903 / NRRL B-16338 / NBRC 102104 / LLR-40K-21) TaxID=446470 RepID=D3Q7W1_STANL|nr:glucarate dehydratase family protein [Stackebrandtia nassauensis]ADD40466.1 Mandelate racemase/muconate lactonizing protein [Stackebrandtia nassauensis DSM 44728]